MEDCPCETLLETNRCVLFIFRPRDISPAWTSGCRMATGPPFLLLRAQPHHLPTTCSDPGLSPKPGSFGGVTVSCATLDSALAPSHTIKFLPRSVVLPPQCSRHTWALPEAWTQALSPASLPAASASPQTLYAVIVQAMTVVMALGNTTFIYERSVLASLCDQAGHLTGSETSARRPLLPVVKS